MAASRLRTEGWYVFFIDPLPYWGGRIALHVGAVLGMTVLGFLTVALGQGTLP